MSDEGFDSPHDFTGNNADRVRSDAESDASFDSSGVDGILADSDAGLAVIVEVWPMLSADAQRAVVEFVRREVGKVLPLQIE